MTPFHFRLIGWICCCYKTPSPIDNKFYNRSVLLVIKKIQNKCFIFLTWTCCKLFTTFSHFSFDKGWDREISKKDSLFTSLRAPSKKQRCLKRGGRGWGGGCGVSGVLPDVPASLEGKKSLLGEKCMPTNGAAVGKLYPYHCKSSLVQHMHA